MEQFWNIWWHRYLQFIQVHITLWWKVKQLSVSKPPRVWCLQHLLHKGWLNEPCVTIQISVSIEYLKLAYIHARHSMSILYWIE